MSWLCKSNLPEDGNRTKLPRPCSQFEFSLQLQTEVNYVALPINTAQDLSLEHPKGKLIYSRNFMDGDLRQIKSIQVPHETEQLLRMNFSRSLAFGLYYTHHTQRKQEASVQISLPAQHLPNGSQLTAHTINHGGTSLWVQKVSEQFILPSPAKIPVALAQVSQVCRI